MLGSMVYKYLSQNPDLEVTYTNRRNGGPFCISDFLDARNFRGNEYLFNKFANADYIINCIGIIKPQIDEQDPWSTSKTVDINGLFPHELYMYVQTCLSRESANKKPRIIHASTDCVFSGEKGWYKYNDIPDPRDLYGLTKVIGESPFNMNLRVSIVGPEQGTSKSLLNWLLDAQGEVCGFTNHLWNGITTLQWAKNVEKIIQEDLFKPGVHHVASPSIVSKKDLLHLIKDTYGLKINILSGQAACAKVMTLSPSLDLDVPQIQDQIKELRDFVS